MSEARAWTVQSASPRAAAAIAAGGVAVLLLTSLPPPQHILSRRNNGDTREYATYARRTVDGQVPYRDFSLEYPPFHCIREGISKTFHQNLVPTFTW